MAKKENKKELLSGFELDSKTLMEERAKMQAQLEYTEAIEEAKGKAENKTQFKRTLMRFGFLISSFILVISVEILLGMEIDKATLPALVVSIGGSIKDLL